VGKYFSKKVFETPTPSLFMYDLEDSIALSNIPSTPLAATCWLKLRKSFVFWDEESSA
jgi:hypothetical protein